MTTYLGVDVGECNYGLAIADGPLATPLSPIKINDVKQATSLLIQLADSHSASIIVLGLPTGKINSLVLELKQLILNSSSLIVILHSESLSTHNATTKLREIGATRKKLQQDHSYAACLILEDYLESLS